MEEFVSKSMDNDHLVVNLISKIYLLGILNFVLILKNQYLIKHALKILTRCRIQRKST